MVELFKSYEERPPFCQAVAVRPDTISAIAEYYEQDGRYDVTRVKNQKGYTLTIQRSHVQESALVVTVPFDVVSTYEPLMLIEGHPPTLTSAKEFHRIWREVGRWKTT